MRALKRDCFRRTLGRLKQTVRSTPSLVVSSFRRTLGRLKLEYGPEAVDGRSTETLYRAEALARNWIRWGKSKKRGDGTVVERTLATKRDDLRIRLEDERNEDLAWLQVYRAMKQIAKMGPENIRLVERSDWGKTLVQDCRGGDRQG